ncbi:leucine rich repeat family protein [Cystoisospora suis]|uniref:Leucine rich repeat family protein n=1 Tax=Cystoisospora suis TaxID=483139 RepID=A0A2C6KJP7_9APIC|nr:leucine rich repeat family protein [Cystoisospora suis]
MQEEEENLRALLREEERKSEEQRRLLRAARDQEEEVNRAIEKFLDKIHEANLKNQTLQREVERQKEVLAQAQDQSSKDSEELRSLRTTVQELRHELRNARSSCLSHEEAKELKKENEELKTQVEEKKKEKEKMEDLSRTLEDVKISLKKKDVECQDAQNTAQLKSRMVVAQEEQIDKMKKQLQAKEETLADLASRLKRKERDAEKKLQEYAERAHEWQAKYEQDLPSLQHHLAAVESELLQSRERQEELTREVQAKDKALEYAQGELGNLTEILEKRKEQIKQEAQRKLREEFAKKQETLRTQLEIETSQNEALREENRYQKRELHKCMQALAQARQHNKERDAEMKILLLQTEKKKATAAETVRQMNGLLQQLQKDCSSSRSSTMLACLTPDGVGGGGGGEKKKKKMRGEEEDEE